MTPDDVAGAARFLTVIGRTSSDSVAGPPPRSVVDAFPVVGALIGMAVGAAWWGSSQWWPPAVAAALVVAADLLITGALHFDGLADCGDALLAPVSRERRHEILRDPHVGAFGLAAAATVLLVRFAALASVAPEPLVLAALWTVSRTVMAVALATRPHARPDGGLGRSMAGGDARLAVAIGTALAVVLGVVGGGIVGLVVVSASAAVAMGVLAFGERQLGGWTGDLLGAAGFLAETVGLLLLAARW